MANFFDQYDEKAQNFFDQYDEPKEKSMLDSVSDFFTGEDRETRATRELPELATSTGFLSSEDPMTVAKVAPALLTTTEPQEMADILKSNFPNIGIQYDEKGNIIAGNNATGERVVLNKPGVSAMDLYNTLGIGSLASTAGAVTGPLKVAAATGATTSAVEAGQSSVGGEFNLSNVIMDVVGAGALEAVPSIVKAWKAKQAGVADQLTKEATQAESARAGERLSPEAQLAQQTEIAKETATQARKSRPDVRNISSEVNPEQSIVESAQRLGIEEQLTPGQVSGSQTYRELEGAVSAIPASQLSAQQKEGALALAQKADDLIEEFGGMTDKSALSESIKLNISNTIKGLEQQADEAYLQINKAIPKNTRVETGNLTSLIDDISAEMGGIDELEPIHKRLLDIATSSPTYARLDLERRKIGQALSKASGPYKDTETGTLKQLYAALTKDQEAAAKASGAGDLWDTAKGLVSKRKDLEDNSVVLMGKDLAGAIIPKLGRAMKQLTTGDYKEFDRVISALPKDQRESAVISALNDVFTIGSRKEKQLSPSGFVDWYEGLKRNKSAFNRIKSNMPVDAAKRLDDIYQVSRGIRNLSAERVRTGVIQGLLTDFDKAGGMIDKLYNLGVSAASAKLGPVSSIANVITKGEKTPITKAADALLSSPEFKRSINSYAEKSTKAKLKQEAANRALAKSEKYQRWLDLMPSDKQREIARVGLVTWLSGEYE